MRIHMLPKADLKLLLEIQKLAAKVTSGVAEAEKFDVFDAYFEWHVIQIQARFFGGYQFH